MTQNIATRTEEVHALDISYQDKQCCIIYGVRIFKFDDYCEYKDFLEGCFLEGWDVRNVVAN